MNRPLRREEKKPPEKTNNMTSLHPFPIFQRLSFPTSGRGIPPAALRARRQRNKVQVQAFFNFGKKEAAPQAQPPKQPPKQPEPQELTPPHVVVTKGKGFEVRFYKPYPVIETEYEMRGDGFDRLGAYCDGIGNAAELKMRSTQPIIMIIRPGVPKVMQLLLVARGEPLAADQFPAPLSPLVRLSVAGGEVLAAMPFEGNATPKVVLSNKVKLLAALKEAGLTPADEEETRLAQYGAVFSLERTNEVLVKVKL